MKQLFFFALLFLQVTGFAQILPDSRRILWQGNVGVEGGIPARTTISTTLSSGASLTTVQNALNAAASSNVVVLGAGTYTFGATLDYSAVNPGVVLRGTINNAAGLPTDTKIILTAGQILMRGPDTYDLSKFSSVENLTDSAKKGDTFVRTANKPAWLVAGSLYVIHQLEDSSFVSLAGIEDTTTANTECRWCNTLSQARTAGQIVKVNSITGSGPYVINLDLPLLYGWSTAFTAQITPAAYTTQTSRHGTGLGLEDLTVEGQYTQTEQHMMVISTCENSWVKNCLFTNTPGGTHIMNYFSYRSEIRDSRFEGTHSFAAGQGYGVGFNYGSSYGLCQNNIFKDLHLFMSSSYGGGGHVFAYNFCKGSGTDGVQTVGIGTHGSHTLMNLWEGNYCEDKIFLDYIHGSSSHQTFLRNYIIGFHPGQQSGLGYAVGNDKYNRFNNYLGNIMGSLTEMSTKEHFAPGGSDATTWVLGNGTSSQLSNDTYGHDDATTMAMIRHGNVTLWNSTSSVDWDSSLPSDRSIPNSYYQSVRPEWFGDRPWPVFTTNMTAKTVYTNIPAGFRYEFGTNPPSPTITASKMTKGRHVGNGTIKF
jgi:hypothetical protein